MTSHIEIEKHDEEERPMTYVDLETHVRFDLPNVLILETGNLPKSKVCEIINDGIKDVISTQQFQPESTFYFLNYATIYNKETKTTTPKGLCFVFFRDPGFPQIFMGRNPDGTERIETYQDPDWKPKEESEEEKVEKEYTCWSDFEDYIKFPDMYDWADFYDDTQVQSPPMLQRVLGPLASLRGVVCKDGFSKINKKFFIGYDHSRLTLKIPTWVDLFELRKVFSIFSKSGSYPILEYSVNPVDNTGSLFVSYSPGSDGAILANLIFFNFTCTMNKKSFTMMPFLSKEGVYPHCMGRGSRYTLTVTSKLNPKESCAVPERFFGNKLVSDGKRETSSIDSQWRSNQQQQRPPQRHGVNRRGEGAVKEDRFSKQQKRGGNFCRK